MTPGQWTLTVCLSLASVFEKTGSMTTIETQKYTCKTFGSGVVKPFSGSYFYVSSNCPFTFTRFTHNRVECDITIRRGASGLLDHVEIIINKIKTVLQNGNIFVESNSVSLPYDHTYQHIFLYGIYTRLRSSLLPLSVTWHTVPGGIDTLWVELEHELSTGIAGLCGKDIVAENNQQLIAESALSEDTCQIRDPIQAVNQICRHFFSFTLDCLQAQIPFHIRICEWNIHSFEESEHVGCALYKEMANHCGNTSYIWSTWRSVTQCAEPTCPGDLVYMEQGAAFVPTCSNPNPRVPNQDVTSTCVCPDGKVLNDRADTYQCVKVSACPCEFAGGTYLTGEMRQTKCQSCVCDGGKWTCSENFCPPRCLIEGQYVTTFDGKQYIVPGKCTYMASKSSDWTVKIEYSKKEASLNMVTLQLYQETFTFANNMVRFGDQDITDLYQSDHAWVFWQSSIYVQVETSFGMKLQVQVSPKVQIYITPPANHTAIISGLCGNSNSDTTDDFTTSSGIIENSAQAFALSWSVGTCAVNIPPTCINTDNEIFADEKCSALNHPTGIFAECHGYIPTDQYHTACIQRTCNCGSNLFQCLCVALSSYANACSRLGVHIGDWRKATNCTLPCPKNMEFSYQTTACNRTCRSLSGPDPSCGLENDPVEGCGCPEGTHLNQGHICTPKAECVCHHHGGTTPPGPVVIDGRQCICENGELHCSKDCGCSDGKVCFHCSEYPVNTALKTCDSLSKPLRANMTCESGCYCPHDQFEDHRGNCVPKGSCTCVFSGDIFNPGQEVRTNCKTCVCGEGQWHCKDEPCPGTCQVYGNGHYQTFDSKWYRFNGHCQYTLVEDYCGKTSGTFSVSVESVPCCDEALTCSRSIILHLQDEVSLILSDMRVTKKVNKGRALNPNPLYTIHTVGLYILISVPNSRLTLIWDKHTRITIELHSSWRNRVCGLCGNFDSNEMNDLHMSGSAVVSSPLAFGNSWKADTPPCSDVTTEIFPCDRNSYCSAWAQRRCLILTGDTFKDCHLKVDPTPYYHACVQESCSCEFEGKFLGFCTSVAAYAEACSDQDVCINWRTPDLCPVYCDYYNEQGQCSWHYEACGKMMTCSKGTYLAHRLEGCYPRCPEEAPYYDENTGKCTPLINCTCLFNDTVVQPGDAVKIGSVECTCENRTFKCPHLTTTNPTTTLPTTTPRTTATTETTVLSTTTTPTTTTITTSTTTLPTTTPSTMATTETTVLSTITTPTTTTIATSTTTLPTTTPSTTATTETTVLSTITTPTTTTIATSTTTLPTTTPRTTATTETTVLSTTTTPTTTTIATSTTTLPTTTPSTMATTETTVLSTTTTPTTMIGTSTTNATWPASTTPPPTTTTSTTRETTVLSTATTPTTTIATSTSTDNWSTSVTTETWSTRPNTTSTVTSTTSGTTSTTPTLTTAMPSSDTPTTSVTGETLWTSPNATSTSTTPITYASSTATSTSVAPTVVKTTGTPTASSTYSTAPTTQVTSITNTTTEVQSTASSASTVTSTTQTIEPTELSVVTDSRQTTSIATSPLTSSQIVFTSTETATSLATIQSFTTISEGTTGQRQSTVNTFTTETTESPTTLVSTTPKECICKDLMRKKSWVCGETWTEDCFVKSCVNMKIELTPVVCPEATFPTCPRDQATRVSDGCCETWKCDCQCELYGDPHYISFQGVAFDFLDDCTYTLVEERVPRHNLTIAVDNFYCVDGIDGSCTKGIILRYQNSIASLSIIPQDFVVQATLNNVTIEPPYEEEGFRFETTGYKVSLYLPEIRSYVSLTPSYTMVVKLDMEHFLNNTQGQCGVCGGPSCIRKGGQIEADDCCDKTSYDWVYPDHSKPMCAHAPRDVPCVSGTTSKPPNTITSTTTCPPSPLCELLWHPVFENCSMFVNLHLKKQNCEFDSCRNPNGSCSSLEQAVDECKKAGFCIDWRKLTNGSCDLACPAGLVYRDCSDNLDDFCYGGVVYPGAPLEKSEGCFCPSGLRRAANHSLMCVKDCPYCKGPHGEPKLPGEVWESNCMLCTCNNRTRREKCVKKPSEPVIVCGPGAVIVNICCGEQICVEKNCTYNGRTYKVGEEWRDATRPCKSFSCSTDGIQTETRFCPNESCPQEKRVWDDEHCCFTCDNTCAPQMSNISVTVQNCTTVVEIPVCQGQCESEPRLVLYGDLRVEQESNCCRETTSESRSVTLQCLDRSTRHYTYKHLTGCECRACMMWH